jgi:hypothetical protein
VRLAAIRVGGVDSTRVSSRLACCDVDVHSSHDAISATAAHGDGTELRGCRFLAQIQNPRGTMAPSTIELGNLGVAATLPIE